MWEIRKLGSKELRKRGISRNGKIIEGISLTGPSWEDYVVGVGNKELRSLGTEEDGHH